jgi:hypothetical protein
MVSDEALRMARAEQANQALKQFLGPAFDVARAEYLEKLAIVASKPLTADLRAGMEKLALAVKVIDVVRSQIESLVADGGVARDTAARAAELDALSPEKKSWTKW